MPRFMDEAVKATANVSKLVKYGIFIAASIFGIYALFHVVENLDADRIMVIQSPWTGNLEWYTSGGPKWQGFGKVTKYYKLDTYEFKIPVRFNDGGHGTIIGSINYEMPLDVLHLTSVHVKYGSQEAVQKQLVETVTNKCVYMTGPLMSSKESYAEKRTSLIRYIEDQIGYGIYRTIQKEVKAKDQMTGQEKTVTVVEIMVDSNGNPQRQEDAVLTSYGIKTTNFAVVELPYDDAVEGQIKQQQKIQMEVQTSMADAKKAEQNAITIAKQGEASAAEAKWAQERIKAQQVTEAQQKLEVAKLNAATAEQDKKRLILEGEGEAAKKRLVMQANGALEQKLETYKTVQELWATAFANFKGNVVPLYMSGNSGSGSSGGNAATNFMDIMTAKAARDLSLDLKTEGNTTR